jgi:hypothetical protein
LHFADEHAFIAPGGDRKRDVTIHEEDGFVCGSRRRAALTSPDAQAFAPMGAMPVAPEVVSVV